MHEHGLCDPVLQVVHQRLPADWSGGRIVVRLRVSELSGLTQAALQAAFDHAHESHQGPRVEVDLRSDSLLGRCEHCGEVVAITGELACTRCGASEVALAAGETLLIEEMELLPGESPPTAAPHEH